MGITFLEKLKLLTYKLMLAPSIACLITTYKDTATYVSNCSNQYACHESLLQGWPKCGPPTYFCGPWTFLVIWKNKNLVKNCTYFFSISIKRTNKFCYSVIETNFKKCGPRWKYIFLFGPRSKKSGHPCSITFATF